VNPATPRYAVWFQWKGPEAHRGTPWLVKGPDEAEHGAYTTKAEAEQEAAKMNARV